MASQFFRFQKHNQKCQKLGRAPYRKYLKFTVAWQTTSIFYIDHSVIIEIYTDELNGSEDWGGFLVENVIHLQVRVLHLRWLCRLHQRAK